MKDYLTITPKKINKKLAEFLETIEQELTDFFGFKAKRPLLFLLDSRENLDIIWGKKTETWFVGAFKNNSVYILNPEVYEKVSSHKKEEFWQTLKHEYCHAYYTQIAKSNYPIWLNEGLASFISGKKLILSNSRRTELLNVFDYFNRADKNVYAIGQFWVEYFIKKSGRKKFIKLITGFPSEFNREKFAKQFYRIYGFKFNQSTLSKFLD